MLIRVPQEPIIINQRIRNCFKTINKTFYFCKWKTQRTKDMIKKLLVRFGKKYTYQISTLRLLRNVSNFSFVILREHKFF